jgi:cbb3-type cytochrome oxidase cytochrome c subunit
MPSALDSATLFMLQAAMAAVVLVVVTLLVVTLAALATYAVILVKHHLDERVAGLKAESRLWTRKSETDHERMYR